MDYSPLGSSLHGILQARILDWVALSFSRDLTNPGMEPSLLRLLHCRWILSQQSRWGSHIGGKYSNISLFPLLGTSPDVRKIEDTPTWPLRLTKSGNVASFYKNT